MFYPMQYFLFCLAVQYVAYFGNGLVGRFFPVGGFYLV